MIQELITFKIFLVLTPSIIAFDIVQSSSSGVKNYLNKCCPMGKYYYVESKKCVNNNTTLTFSETKIYDEDITLTGKSFEDLFTLIPNKIANTTFRRTAMDVVVLEYNVYLTESGVLQLELPNAYNRWISIPIDNYCIEYRSIKGHKEVTLRFWVQFSEEDFVQSDISSQPSDYLKYGVLVSCFFMLLVLLVYALLPELHNLCGVILMAYVFSLFMAFLLLFVIQNLTFPSERTCIGLTTSTYFFFLAAFCWMSVMSYDIWCTFRGIAKLRRIHRRGDFFKFMIYSLFAFGIPLIMTICLAVLNTIQDYMRQLPWFVIPRVPEFGCFLEGGVKLLYLYMPMLILIICNWMFYLMTAFNIWCSSRSTAVLDSVAASDPQAQRTHRHRLMVYLKLSVVMGLNWLLEVVGFLYPDFEMWGLFHTYNSLIGLMIFLIFICKMEILRKLRKRYLEKKTLRWYAVSSKSNYLAPCKIPDESVTTIEGVVPN